MDNMLQMAMEWTRARQSVAIATVIETWGSSPRPVGSQLIVNKDGSFLGSVSGGCIEGAVITEAADVIADGRPRVCEFSVDNEQAWQVGLTCGGTIKVLLTRGAEHEFVEAVHAAHAGRRPFVVVTDISSGGQALIDGDQGRQTAAIPDEVLDMARSAQGERQSRTVEHEGTSYFLHVVPRASRLVVVGAVHVAQALAPMASLAGFEVVLVDPRRAFATPERFPELDLRPEWPDEYFAANPIDNATAVATLTHDPKLDDPALLAALDSEAFYIGALGSRKTHAKRVARLEAAGVTAECIASIEAPIGLDLGGRKPGEIAVAVLAQVVQAWNKR